MSNTSVAFSGPQISFSVEANSFYSAYIQQFTVEMPNEAKSLRS